MAVQCPKMTLRVTEVGSSLTRHPLPWQINFGAAGTVWKLRLQTIALSGDGKKPAATPNSNYVVPLDKSSCITRPLAEILRDLNKRVPDNIIKTHDSEHPTSIPWYQANRMLSFYAPGWCGEVRDVIFSENGSVTVVYRVTVRGSDGEQCFSKDYRKTALPLTKLCKGTEAQLAFEALLQAITTAPVLAVPNFVASFCIECNVSGSWLGDALLQNQRPVAYFSKALSIRNASKSTYEEELMALVLEVLHWCPYPLGLKFLVGMDHHSLKHILQQSIMSPTE